MQFAASVILCVILKIISYRLDYSTMCSQYYCFETIRRGTYCEVKSISFSGQQSLGSIRKHFFAFIWEMKLGYWKSTVYPIQPITLKPLYFPHCSISLSGCLQSTLYQSFRGQEMYSLKLHAWTVFPSHTHHANFFSKFRNTRLH